MRFGGNLALAFSVMAAAVMVAPASAAIVNGSFETGTFAGWTTSGETGIAGNVGTPAIRPRAGAFQAVVTTAGGSPILTPNVPAGTPVATLESFFGLATDTFQSIRSINTTGDAVSGAGFYQDVALEAGDTLTFGWSFVTREAASDNAANDYAFVVIGDVATRLVASNDRENGPLIGSNVTFQGSIFRSSTLANFTKTFDTAGTYRIGVGAISVLDERINSALFVDNFVIRSAPGPVPEQATWAMLIGGFGVVGGTMRQRRRSVLALL